MTRSLAYVVRGNGQGDFQRSFRGDVVSVSHKRMLGSFHVIELY